MTLHRDLPYSMGVQSRIPSQPDAFGARRESTLSRDCHTNRDDERLRLVPGDGPANQPNCEELA